MDRQTIAKGINHTAIIKKDGTLWSYGSNYNGQLGNNSDVMESSDLYER